MLNDVIDRIDYDQLIESVLIADRMVGGATDTSSTVHYSVDSYK